jgi:hypothetical protein
MCSLRFQNNFLTIGLVCFRFENSCLAIERVHFASKIIFVVSNVVLYADSSAWGRHSIGVPADFADKPNWAGRSVGVPADVADSSAWGGHEIGVSADFADKPDGAGRSNQIKSLFSFSSRYNRIVIAAICINFWQHCITHTLYMI